jgi:hypothetical protein
VGKSTLAVRFTKDLESRAGGELAVELIHKGPPIAHPLDEYVLPLTGYRPFTGHHVVCDRWHWGESVYPHVFGRTTQLDDAVRYHIELFLMSRGAYVVHVSGPEDRTTRCIEHRGDHLVNVGQVEKMHSLFEDCERMSLNPFTRVDGHAVYDDALRYMNIIERAGSLGRSAAKLRHFTTYVGSPSPKLLLLGDVRGKSMPTCDDLRPAFMPYPSTSGHYMLTQLTRYLNITQLRHIGIANACDVDDAERLWETLGRPYTVTLGRHADKSVGKWAGHSVPHPQFVRRFKNSQGGEYVSDIIDGTPIARMEHAWSSS